MGFCSIEPYNLKIDSNNQVLCSWLNHQQTTIWQNTAISKKIFAVGYDCFVVYASIFVGQIFVVLCSPSTNYILHPFANRFNDWRDTTMLLERCPLDLFALIMYAQNDEIYCWRLYINVKCTWIGGFLAVCYVWYQHHFLMNMIVLLNDRQHSTTKVIKSTDQVTTGLGRLVRLVSTSCS